MSPVEIPVGGILMEVILLAPKLIKWAKTTVTNWRHPYQQYWLDEKGKTRRRLLFGMHSPPGLWIQPGINTWNAIDSKTGEKMVDSETGNPVVYAPDGVPRPTFNYRGYRQVFAVGDKANALFNSSPETETLYPNRLYVGGENINQAGNKALREVERAHSCRLEPMRFRTNIVSHPPDVYDRLLKINRVFIEDGVRYEKQAVVDEHQFLLDTKGSMRPGARVEEGVLVEDFLLISILPNSDRTGRIISVVARYGACERLHDLLLHPEIVDAIWEDTSATRKPNDTDMRYPWVQALFSVGLTHWPVPETYEWPRLKHIHWMPEYGPILEDRSDLRVG